MKNPILKPSNEASDLESLSNYTLRDHFAGLAMQALISNSNVVDDISTSVSEWVSIRSYLISDAMLKERENENRM